MKLPNGYGSVHKLSGKRRKPWRVRISAGYSYNEEKDTFVRKYKTLGYFDTRKLALEALADYNKNPYDLDVHTTTFAELYDKWFEGYSKKQTVSANRTIIAARRYCSSIENMRVKDIRSYHLKECINNGYVISTEGKDKGKKRDASPTTKGRMKSMVNLMWDYACEHEITDKNYARLFNLDEDIIKEREENKKDIIPFAKEEIKKLWDNLQVPFADMLLIDIYSGWRPQELAILLIENIDLENNTMMGGMKNEAGRDRIVPIHPLIRPLIENRYKEAMSLNSDYLFNDINGQQGTFMTYDKYRSRFNKVMKRLNMSHRPHECRHTFITKGKESQMDEYILKLIVGHAINDITEKVYTHRTIEQLQSEILKIKE